MSPDVVTAHKGRWALFLDVDGILLDRAETPRQVHASEEIKQVLIGLAVQLDGAVALLSGRSLDDVDRLFSPLRFCVAGMRSWEFRESSGCVTRTSPYAQQLAMARERLRALVQRHDGLHLEESGDGLAVNFQLASHLKDEVYRAVEAACRGVGSRFAVKAGLRSVEISPSECTAATAISLFMRQTPFSNRTPVLIGHHATDESGFAIVNELGGVSIKVGDSACTVARHRLPDVDDVIQWLGSVAAKRTNCAE